MKKNNNNKEGKDKMSISDFKSLFWYFKHLYVMKKSNIYEYQ